MLDSYEQIILPIIFVAFLFTLYHNKNQWAVLFSILKRCWFPIVTVLLAIFIFVGTAQGRDIINEVDFARSGYRKFTTIIALWLWGYNSFKLSATAVSLLDSHSVFSGNRILRGKIISVVPAVLGCLPWITALLVMSLSKNTPDKKILVLLTIVFYFFIIYLLLRSNKQLRIGRRIIDPVTLHIFSAFIFYVYHTLNRPTSYRLNKFLSKKQTRSQTTTTIPGGESGRSWRLQINAEQVINWGAHFILFLLISLFPIPLAKFFGPIGLIFIALSSYAVVGTIFIYLKERFGYPIFPVFLIAIFIFTSVSDNNTAGEILQVKNDKRELLLENFSTWIKDRSTSEDSIQVNLVAAEGGGLRSAFWTFGVLQRLQKEHPNFYRDLYAISCVSGGSVGSALFCSEQLTGFSDSLTQAPILNNDNLSPMIAALFFRELVQSLLPFNIESLDRSRVMDHAFETFWQQKHPHNKVWEEEFIDLWKHDKHIPALFINSIHVESGSSAVLSNLQFDPKEIQSLDMMHMTRNNLSLSKVVGISSRFPYLQAPAKFEYSNGTSWGHLADGGYYENSGVSVAYQIYLTLRKKLSSMSWKIKPPKVKFNIILISNGEESKSRPPSLFLNEINAPLNTLLNSWYSRGYSYAHIAKLTTHHINPKDQFYDIRLNRKKGIIPLGWYLSVNSRNEIIKQLKNLDQNPEYLKFIQNSY